MPGAGRFLLACVAAALGCGGARHPRPPRDVAGCDRNAALDGQGNLIVTGRWRGEPVKVLVDTGANGGSIASTLVERHQLPAIGNASYAGATGNFVDTTLHDPGPLELGGATVATRRFFAQASHNERYDFAIGLDTLAGHAAVVDLAHQSFCLTASPNPLATEPMRIAGDERNRDIVVAARFGDVELPDMILDTGAGVTTVNQDQLGRIEHTQLAERAEAVDGTGQVVELPLVTVPEVCVGGACAADHVVMPSEDLSALVGHHVDGIVGLPFFADHVLVLDFPASRIGIR